MPSLPSCYTPGSHLSFPILQMKRVMAHPPQIVVRTKSVSKHPVFSRTRPGPPGGLQTCLLLVSCTHFTEEETEAQSSRVLPLPFTQELGSEPGTLVPPDEGSQIPAVTGPSLLTLSP